MKMKVNGVMFEIVLSFASPGSVAPWQAEAYKYECDAGGNLHPSGFLDLVSSGTTPDTALQAIALELSEIY